jgi:CRISPR/Cas system CSM-associated protein Csm3 (group 7 of RAMP superfamily)
MSNLVINVLLNSVAPFSCAVPVAPDARGDGPYKNFPLMATGVDEGGEKTFTGIIPAGTLRGRMRHLLSLAKMKAAVEDGKPYTVEAVYEEMIGQMGKSKAEAVTASIKTIGDYRDQNDITDLFGVGLAISSRLMVSHLRPAADTLPDYYAGVRHDVVDDEEVMALISADDQAKSEARAGSNADRAKAESLVKQLQREIKKAKKAEDAELVAQLEGEMEKAKADAEGNKAAMGEMDVTTQLPVGYFAMPAGCEYRGRIVVRDVKERDEALIMSALEQLSLLPVLGAQSARGCGEIEGTFTFVREGVTEKIVKIGGFKAAEVVNLG